MIYQTFHLEQNPQAEYQRRQGVWYKRGIGSSDVFVPVAKENQKFMESYFSKRYGFLYQYSNSAKIGAVALVGLGIYAYIKYIKKRGVSKV
jgi:hypothetical protein